jgi:hypothetical protein
MVQWVELLFLVVLRLEVMKLVNFVTGTRKDMEVRGSLGVGAYFTPIKDVAEGYARESGGRVIETRLRVRNPLKIESGDRSHPMIAALVQLGVNEEKAVAMVEKEEEKHGYMGGQVKKLALAQGYDAIFQYFNGTLREIVVWSANQVKYQT